MTIPYGLGFFGNGPDTSGFEPSLAAFKALMGAAPTWINVYMDFTQAALPNTGSAAYGASTFNQSGQNTNAFPLIGMTISSSAVSTADNVTFLENLANTTQFDAAIEGMVVDWVNAGYKTQYWRPCVEMNLTSTPGFEAWVNNPALFIAAFKKVYTLLHEAFSANGVEGYVIWNPGCNNSTPAGLATETLYPGNAFVDIIGGDWYDDLWPFSGSAATIEASPALLEAYYANPAEGGSTASCLSLTVLMDFALANGKPFCLPECGCGDNPSDNPTFPAWTRQTMDAYVAKGLQIEFISIWSNGSYNFLDNGKPNEAAAWAANFGVNAPPIAAKPPVTPPAHAASPANTTVKGTSGTIYDTAGNAWTIAANGQIDLNGAVVTSSWDVTTLFWTGTALYQLNTSGNWYEQPLSNTNGTPITGAPPGYGTVTPPVVTHAASPAGTFLPPTPAVTTIYDTAGTAWTLPTVGGQIYRQAAGATSATVVASSAKVELLWWTGTELLQLNSSGAWWTQPLDGSAGVPATAPTGYKA
jgi:hypothetical protein